MHYNYSYFSDCESKIDTSKMLDDLDDEDSNDEAQNSKAAKKKKKKATNPLDD